MHTSQQKVTEIYRVAQVSDATLHLNNIEQLNSVIFNNKITGGAVVQWLAFATRDRKVASSIPDRGIPRNNLG